MAKHPHDSSRPPSKGMQDAVSSGDIERVKTMLSLRQRRFCEEYMIDYNATASVVRAGYSINSAEKQAHLLKNNIGIQAYLDHLSRSKEAKITVVNPDYVIARVCQIIDAADKPGDQLRGLELLARHLGMFVDRTEITGKDGGAIETVQRTQEEAERFKELISQMRERDTDSKMDVELV